MSNSLEIAAKTDGLVEFTPQWVDDVTITTHINSEAESALIVLEHIKSKRRASRTQIEDNFWRHAKKFQDSTGWYMLGHFVIALPTSWDEKMRLYQSAGGDPGAGGSVSPLDNEGAKNKPKTFFVPFNAASTEHDEILFACGENALPRDESRNEDIRYSDTHDAFAKRVESKYGFARPGYGETEWFLRGGQTMFSNITYGAIWLKEVLSGKNLKDSDFFLNHGLVRFGANDAFMGAALLGSENGRPVRYGSHGEASPNIGMAFADELDIAIG